jgi:hypothetical protein
MRAAVPLCFGLLLSGPWLESSDAGTAPVLRRKLLFDQRPWFLPLCKNDEDWTLPSLPCILNLLIVAPCVLLISGGDNIFNDVNITCADESNTDYFGEGCICEYEQLKREITNFKYANVEELPVCPGKITFEDEICLDGRDFQMNCFGQLQQDPDGLEAPQCVLDGQGATRLFTGQPEYAVFSNMVFSNGKADQGRFFLCMCVCRVSSFR